MGSSGSGPRYSFYYSATYVDLCTISPLMFLVCFWILLQVEIQDPSPCDCVSFYALFWVERFSPWVKMTIYVTLFLSSPPLLFLILLF